MSDPDDDCPLCRGDYPDDLVEKIRSAKPLGTRLTLNEALAWVRGIDSDPH